MTQRFRLFPIVIVTAATVLGLKVTEIARNDEISIESISVALAQDKPSDKKAADEKSGDEAEAMDKKAEEGGEKSATAESIKGDKKKGKDDKEEAKAPKEQAVTSLSQSEVALLESLLKRRLELDERDKKLDLRQQLLKVAEKRIDEKIAKLEDIRDEIIQRTVIEKKLQKDKYKKLVLIYEGMKPKEAARIFSRLDGKIVLQVAEHMAARKMSAILAKMSAEAAERLTIQLARKAAGKGKTMKELPEIGEENSG